jgi:hypothetical protein
MPVSTIYCGTSGTVASDSLERQSFFTLYYSPQANWSNV